MYCKLFASLYQGTLRGRAHEILVFTNLLAHCDRDGFVDKHFKAIADETGLPLDAVKQAIENLEAADPESRSPDEGGARITRMDNHRVWGWRVVNYAKYRAIRDFADKREQNRIAQARYRAAKQETVNKPPSSKVSLSKPPSDTVSRNQPQSAHAEATGSRQQGDGDGLNTLPADGGRDDLTSRQAVVETSTPIVASKPSGSPAVASEGSEPSSGASDRSKARQRAAKASPDGLLHAAFIAEWCAAFENDRGVSYKVDGGRDGKAVKELLSFSKDVEELVALAQSAWSKSGPKFWWCERAVTIHAFASRLNEIRAELSAANEHTPPVASMVVPILAGKVMKF